MKIQIHIQIQPGQTTELGALSGGTSSSAQISPALKASAKTANNPLGSTLNVISTTEKKNKNSHVSCDKNVSGDLSRLKNGWFC